MSYAIRCRTCGKSKEYEEFIDKYEGRTKSKFECWECYNSRKKVANRKRYARRKKDGTLPIVDRSQISVDSLLWAKIISKKSPKNKDNERSSSVNLTRKEFKEWFEKNYDGTCYYCGVTLDQYRSSSFLQKIRPHISNFGTDRKNTQFGYDTFNIAVCCHFCNSVKGSFFSDEEFKEIGKKYIRKLYD